MKNSGIVVLLTLFLLGLAPQAVHAQAYETQWISIGSLQNWYANMGCEIEEGRVKKQQDGLQWEAIYANQDMQAAKGLWIGAVNFKDPDGTVYPHKVIGVGPRYDGKNVFTPTLFELVTKMEPPSVTVDGVSTTGRLVDIKRVDPTIAGDRMIVNELTTALGLKMTRKTYAFSQQYHDNYIVSDYRFTNTSNVRLDSVVFYFQYRLAVCATTRYVIGNATGWGINTMLGTRGDGVKTDTDDAVNVPGVYTAPHMRIQYAWHGKYPSFTQYDNVGGPIWVPASVANYGDPADTVGRLGAAQFVGIATIHADKSASDSTDDLSQPSTTSYEDSDDPFASADADMFNAARMTAKYTTWMNRGHKAPRHADVVEPTGTFDDPKGDPSLGKSGGWSNANGYGPYTINPGEDVHIVMVEAVAGLDRNAQISVGRKFKAATISAKVKNDSVLTGKDSLFQTVRRAIANYKSGFQLPPSPLPPRTLTVTSAGDKIGLTWDTYSTPDAALNGFRVYRALGRSDGEYTLLGSLPKTGRSFDDTTALRGRAYYYYVVSVGDPALNTGQALTPAGVPLLSSRYYTQTYEPAYLKRAPGKGIEEIRIVPNPYSISAPLKTLRFEGEGDKIAFFNIPGQCRIRIFTELGELIKEIEHTDGSGDAYWNSVTSSNQVIVSGIYIVVFENLQTGERIIKKLSVIR
jgi:hypothetical protein